VSVASWQRWVVVCAGALLASLVSVPAWSLLEVSLEYAVPSGIGCPSEAQFRAAVAERLGGDPFVKAAARTVEVEISAKDGRLRGVLRWVDREGTLEGQRRFEAPAAECSELARNMAFAVTVQLELLEQPEDASEPTTTPGSDSEVETEAAPVASARTPTSTSAIADASVPVPAANFELGAGVGPFLASGWAPHVAGGGRVLLLGGVPRFLVQVAFEATLPQRYSTSEGAGFKSSVLAASVAPCWRFPVVETCPVLRLGWVRAQGFGVDEPQSPRGTFWEAGFRLAAGWALQPRFEGKAHLELLYTPSPWGVVLDGRSVFVAPSFAVLGGIDLALFFL